MYDMTTWFLGFTVGLLTGILILHYYWTRIIEPVIKARTDEICVCLDIMTQDQIDEFVKRTD